MAIYQGGRKVGAIVPVVMSGEYNIEQTIDGDVCELNITTAGQIENKLPQLVDGNVIELTAKDLAGATKIRGYAFASCVSLISVTMPDSITSISNNAFQNCAGLTSVLLSKNITSIGLNSFYNCPNLSEITIPNSVTSIGSNAFRSCNNLTTMTLLPKTPPTLNSSNAISSATTTIYIPKGTLSAYNSATNWSDFASKFVEMEA